MTPNTRLIQSATQNGKNGSEHPKSGQRTVPICVLGMHRSGTSLTTYAIRTLGFDVGEPEKLHPADQFNPKGFWENKALLAVNEELLSRLGGSWDDPPLLSAGWERSAELFDLRAKAEKILSEQFGDRKDWVWKDPRLSLTLPFWLPFLPTETAFVICYRNPIEVCRSLQEAGAYPPIKSSYMWQYYLTSAIVATQGRRRYMTDFEDWFKPGCPELDRLALFALGRNADSQEQKTVALYLEGQLRHHQSTVRRSMEESQIDFTAKLLYRALLEAGSSEPATIDAMNEMCRSLFESNRSRRSAESELAKAIPQIQELVAQNKRIATEAADMSRRLKQLNVERVQADKAQANMAEAQRVILTKGFQIIQLEKQLAQQKQELEKLAAQRKQDLEKLSAERKQELERLSAERKQELERLSAERKQELEILCAERQQELEKESALRQHAQHVQYESERKIASLQNAMGDLSRRAIAKELQIKELLGVVNRIDTQMHHTRARLMALQQTKLFRYTKGLRALWMRLRPQKVSDRTKQVTAGPLTAVLKTRGRSSARLRIRQVYFSNDQISSLMKKAVPLFNEKGDEFLENRLIIDGFRRQDHLDCDYYGVFSWRFFQKTQNKFTFESIQSFIDTDPEKADVYSFFETEPQANIWRHAVDMWHPPLLIEIAQKIFDRLGHKVDVLELNTKIVYSNHWLAKPEVFARYVSEMLIPAVELMENDPEIRELCFRDSRYGELFLDPHYRGIMGNTGITTEECLKLFGKPYYPHHTFICERLMSSWLAMNPSLRLTHIP